jgi:hypothetical protein
MMYLDQRLGPHGDWYAAEPKGVHLRLPDYIKSIICFLCVESKEQILFGGTGFFVTLVSAKHPELSFTYLVTAKHCVLKAYERFGHMKARSNLKDRSRAVLVNLDQKEWVFSEDPGIDIAVMSVSIHQSIEAMTLPCEHFASDKNIEDFSIGIGDETTTVGLFTQRYGKKLNIPILRSGIVAAIPEEVLYDPATGAEFHAYLVEMRSIGGLSGSPVFVSVPPYRARGLNREDPNAGYSIPIGVVRGHWEMAMEKDDSIEDFMNEGKMNMGIAMVTPIQEVATIIMDNQKLKDYRRNMEEQLVKGQLMVEDSSFE